MRANARSGLLALTAVTVAVSVPSTRARAQAPTPPATAPKAAAPPAATAPAPIPQLDPAVLKQTVATVNGEPITRGQVLDIVSRYLQSIPPGSEEQIYRDAVDSIANNRLLRQYLNRQKVTVPPEKVDAQISMLDKQLKQGGSDLATELLRNGKPMAELRSEIGDQIRLVEFLDERATDHELKKYVAAHRDLFNGTQVKASHILLRVDPKATPEEKEKIKQKLAGIKRDIETNKITFAEAANKYSEDPGNQDKDGTGIGGGDLGYFTLNSGFVEEFTNAAFALKKGSISDVVETPYGYHLIQVTDRKEGNPFDFEKDRLFARQRFGADLQKEILTAERKKAKIEVKPMPPDLFPPTQAPAAAPAAEKAATKGAVAK
jgi:parvulin-like peptidyl-prolyl isomerase